MKSVKEHEHMALKVHRVSCRALHEKRAAKRASRLWQGRGLLFAWSFTLREIVLLSLLWRAYIGTEHQVYMVGPINDDRKYRI